MMVEAPWQEGRIVENGKQAAPQNGLRGNGDAGSCDAGNGDAGNALASSDASKKQDGIPQGEDFLDELQNCVNWLEAKLPCNIALDYRYRALVGSDVSTNFETAISRSQATTYTEMNFPINSSWHGLRAAIDQPTWGVHFEWMMPQQSIDGHLLDYDWQHNPDDSYRLTDIGVTREKWLDANMIDIGIDFQLSECTLNRAIETWPMMGFRWQRFHMLGFDGQALYDEHWISPPIDYPGNVLWFNQQFYMLYFGCQFRAQVRCVALTFQVDGGPTWGYNSTNYEYRTGDLYTMEATQGGSWHFGVTAEVPLSERFCLGFQVDHIGIRTYGTHRYQNIPLNETGVGVGPVSVLSEQTSLMAYVRLRL